MIRQRTFRTLPEKGQPQAKTQGYVAATGTKTGTPGAEIHPPSVRHLAGHIGQHRAK